LKYRKLNNNHLTDPIPPEVEKISIFLEAIYKNNIEVVKLLIKYANQHQIILKLNEKK